MMMSQAEQTLESIQPDFDRIALLEDGIWNHNRQYHEFLINQLPAKCRNILEIGCGTGEFSRLLAKRAEKVLAVDLSPQMIRIARERSKFYPNIEFIEGDAVTLQLPDAHFDCIASLTTLHHLPMTSILKRIKKALALGGVKQPHFSVFRSFKQTRLMRILSRIRVDEKSVRHL